jgi:hypothetical protein
MGSGANQYASKSINSPVTNADSVVFGTWAPPKDNQLPGTKLLGTKRTTAAWAFNLHATFQNVFPSAFLDKKTIYKIPYPYND